MSDNMDLLRERIERAQRAAEQEMWTPAEREQVWQRIQARAATQGSAGLGQGAATKLKLGALALTTGAIVYALLSQRPQSAVAPLPATERHAVPVVDAAVLPASDGDVQIETTNRSIGPKLRREDFEDLVDQADLLAEGPQQDTSGVARLCAQAQEWPEEKYAAMAAIRCVRWYRNLPGHAHETRAMCERVIHLSEGQGRFAEEARAEMSRLSDGSNP